MVQDHDEAATEDRTRIRIAKFVALDELEDVIDVKQFLSGDFQLLLNDTDYANKVQKSILNFDAFWDKLSIEVLVENLLDHRIAYWVELYK